MSRARNIKPGFFENEILAGMPFEHRLLFIGLWTMADREGRFEDRPTRIKMKLFAADSLDVDVGLQALHDAGFIQRYEADGKRYCQVLAWGKHQSPHFKEQQSTIPAPGLPQASTGFHKAKEPANTSGKPESCRADSLIPDSLSKAEEQSKDVAAQPAAARPKRGSRLPDGWVPDESLLAWATKKHPNVDAAFETEKFTDHWRAKSGREATKDDWPATWRNWIRNATSFANSHGATNGNRTQGRRLSVVERVRAINEEAEDRERRERESGSAAIEGQFRLSSTA